MSFEVGDILHILAPNTGYKKYHICLGQNEYVVTICLFLNSESGFAGNVEFDGSEFPMLPKSDTGKTVVSLSMLPRYTEKQLATYKAEKLGELPKDVCERVLAMVRSGIKTLTKPERDFVAERLAAYLEVLASRAKDS